MIRRSLALLFAALAVLAVAGAPAQAASRDEILQDCADDGELSGNYSPKEIRDAKKNIPTDVDEYTDCRDVLNRASASGGGNDDGDTGSTGGGSTAGGGSGGGSTAASGDGSSAAGGGSSSSNATGRDSDGKANGTRFNRPDDRELEKLNQIQQGTAPQATVNGRQVSSGGAPDTDGGGNGIPGSVIAVLVLLGLAGAAAAAYATRSFMNRRSGGFA